MRAHAHRLRARAAPHTAADFPPNILLTMAQRAKVDRVFPATGEELLASDIYNRAWYYQIELLPGIVTQGQYGHATTLTRHLLKSCDVEGQRCLDIGPMEGMIAALLTKRGAAKVLATDITDHNRQQVECVQHYHGTEFEYITNVALADLPRRFRKRGVEKFDLVVLSGVLYHVWDVPSALMAVRALLRTGGLMIVETWVRVDQGVAMFFNQGGVITSEPNTYWFLTVECLDYLLRFCSLAPLDVAYLDEGSGRARLAVVCRATEAPVADPGDTWMSRAVFGFDFQDQLRRHRIDDPTRASCEYRAAVDPALLRESSSLDLRRALGSRGPHPFTDEELVLRLRDAS
jgi:2-polyprenyl-3-methyl-5-hydroxy-6-metoxy-1,4-benzoquinol methylase